VDRHIFRNHSHSIRIIALDQLPEHLKGREDPKGCKRPVHMTTTRQGFSDASHSHISATATSYCHPLKHLGTVGGARGRRKGRRKGTQHRPSIKCLAPQQTHFALGENKLAETQSPKSPLRVFVEVQTNWAQLSRSATDPFSLLL